MAIQAPPIPTEIDEIDYPETDGKPMGETETHVRASMDTLETLWDWFRDAPDIYVIGNMLMYYQQGNPRKFVVPDVFVVLGTSKHVRRTYKIWEEGRPPTVVIEFTSRSTQNDDQRDKYDLYTQLGVAEYFLCDPLAEYLQPPLRGYVLLEGKYVPIPPAADGSLLSRELGLRLRREGGRLRLLDAASGSALLHPDEVAEARRQAQENVRTEAAARRQADEARRQAQENVRAEAAARRLAEQQLAATAGELAQLRAELERLRASKADAG